MSEYIFYETDASFCYGDFPNSCYCDTELHGFELTTDFINGVDVVNLDTLYGFGDYSDIKREAKTLSELKEYLISHLEDIEKEDTRVCIEELIEIIIEQIERENKRKVA